VRHFVIPIRNLSLLVLILGTSMAMAESRVDNLLSRDPSAEAEQAFAQGDKRYLVVPVCDGSGGAVLPGWPLGESPEAWQAIESGKRPVTCADMNPDPPFRTFKRVATYAEQYNRRLRELANQGGK
jgi:hypothetical protein